MSKTTVKLFDSSVMVFRGMIRLLARRKFDRVLARLTELLTPIVRTKTEYGAIQFYCPGVLLEYRARTLLTKEPETIEWLETFESNDVFWDIGANVGMYSLYAAVRNRVTVLAFEPSPANYHVLNKNIELNRLDAVVSAYCLAFFDQTGIDSFYMSDTQLGSALNSFGKAVDSKGQPLKSFFRQAMVGYSVDEFVSAFEPPFPTRVKIDVDGQEGKILVGAQKTLSDRRLKSLAVELDTGREDYEEIVRGLATCGLKLSHQRQSPGVDKSDSWSVLNHFFVRAEAQV